MLSIWRHFAFVLVFLSVCQSRPAPQGNSGGHASSNESSSDEYEFDIENSAFDIDNVETESPVPVMVPPSSPVAHSTSSGFDLPEDIQQEIIARIDSFEGMSKCRRVCKYWSKLVPVYSSPQDILQRIAEGDVQHAKFARYLLRDMVEHVDSLNTCSVQERFLFQSVAKLGYFDSMENLFNSLIKYDEFRLQSYMKWFGHLVFGKVHQDTLFQHNDEVVREWLWWYLEKLVVMEKKASMVDWRFHRKLCLDRALERGFWDILHHPSLQSLVNGLQDELILEAATTTDQAMWHQFFMKPILNRPVLDSDEWKALGKCVLCSKHDLDTILDKFPQQKQVIVNNAFTSAILHDNDHMFDILTRYHPAVGQDEFEGVLASGNRDMLQWMQQRGFHLTFHSLFSTYKHHFKMSMQHYNDYILHHPQLTLEQAQSLLTVYMERACGNSRDMEAFKKLVDIPLVSIQQEDVSRWISRPDYYVLSESMFRPDRGHVCLKNESTQMLHHIMSQGYIPVQHHLDLAIERGRLDIVKLIYEQGRLNGAHLEFHPRQSWTYLMARAEMDEQPYQEAHLIEYILDHLPHGRPLPHQVKEIYELLYRQLDLEHTMFDWASDKRFDCYFNHVFKQLTARHIH